jgi:pyruvate dehydrogenase E1 component
MHDSTPIPLPAHLIDPDPTETGEWIESLQAIVDSAGPERAHFLLHKLHESLRTDGIDLPYLVQSPYVNTIPPDKQPAYPGDLAMEQRIRRIVRWNAAVMVHRANHHHPGIGGHLSSYASAAMLYEVGFNWFFKSPLHPSGGDQVYFQGHSAPGVYSRAFLEGRLTDAQLDHFRREAFPFVAPDGRTLRGVSSYPHPRLMPDFWQFSTVSMGLGPIAAIYQARFNRYLHARGIKDTSQQRVWCFLGDGETDEPESLGALSLAAREKLDNLTFVVNCNLQRLDGPVRGNGKIIQELESVFRGAGWHVVKVVWGSGWDRLLDDDKSGLLRKRMDEVVDGQYQKYATASLDYVQDDFFGKYQELRELTANLSQAEFKRFHRGGHDPLKVYAAYDAAVHTKDQPTVVLAKTVKGYALGEGIEARNATHQQKKFGIPELQAFRTALKLPISDEALDDAPFYHPGENSPEVEYIQKRRKALGGPIPLRQVSPVQVAMPDGKLWERFHHGSGTAEVSTTVAFVGVLHALLRDPAVGKRIVPIVCDEARTFGMESMFKPFGIYSSVGQLYTPVDADYVMAYREAQDGQLLQEGITEAGSLASFLAAGTSYSTHGEPMVPCYLYYSMFGFQRVGDQIWQAADMNCRGFLLGCTAGRTTLNGEGLQHEDGHSLLLASTNPGVVSYEPSYAYEAAVIAKDGLRRMLGGEDVMYYLALQNEAYTMPAMPQGAEEGILRGAYLLRRASDVAGARIDDASHKVQLIGSGSILAGVLAAQQRLVHDGVAADVWSATSYGEMRRDAMACDAANRQGNGDSERVPYVVQTLGATEGIIVAASDWMRAVPDQVAPWLGGRLTSLGTDGFGMSDTREALRRHFEVDADAVVQAVRWRLARK